MSEYELAEWLHDNYEEIATKKGWDTQDNCKVKFTDLPKENQAVMYEMACRIKDKFNLK